MNFVERFNALPRARRGSEVMVIATEAELASIIGDAQASEAEFVIRTGTGELIWQWPTRLEVAQQAPDLEPCTCHGGPHGGYTCPRCR